MIRIDQLYICWDNGGSYIGLMTLPGVVELWLWRLFISYGRRPIGKRSLDERLRRFVRRERRA